VRIASGLIALSLAAAAMLPACGLDDEGTGDATDEDRQELSGAARRPRSERIRDVSASTGLTNGVLLAGIASVETGLSHCWSEATWACQGPRSSFCNGPVIAGASDGPCSAQQGGLGMFQFDAGTYQQTLNRDGTGVLQLDGNISRAVDFVTNIVIQEVGGVDTRAQAIAWMNSVPVVAGNARFNQWGAILACRYNGRCGSAAQAAKYKDATISMLNEFGAAFWNVNRPQPPPSPAPTPSHGADAERLVAAVNPAGQIEVFWIDASAAIMHAAQQATGWSAAALGGSAKELAIGNNADGRIELFYVGTNDQLFHRVQLGTGGWSGEIAFGVAGRDIAVGRNSDGRLELFFTDTANAIHHAWQTAPNASWTGASALGGAAKDLEVGANADGRLEVFYVGTNDQLFHRVQIAGGWSGEIAFGFAGKDLAVGRNADGRLELFFTTPGDAIQHAWQTAPNAGWTGASALGGLAKRLDVGNNADGRLEVFYVGTNDQLFHRVQIAGGWSGEIAFGLGAKDLAASRNSDGRLELFYATPAGALNHAWQVAPNGSWSGGSGL
jgi:hypothetical protein